MTLKNDLANVNRGNRSIFKSGLLGVSDRRCHIFAAFTTSPAQAQTFEVLHGFFGKGAGDYPYAGVSLDQAGNVYGTTFYGGYFNAAPCAGDGCGIALKLNPAGQQTVIYSFKGRGSGDRPTAGWSSNSLPTRTAAGVHRTALLSYYQR
jgi:hypothetical protein